MAGSMSLQFERWTAILPYPTNMSSWTTTLLLALPLTIAPLLGLVTPYASLLVVVPLWFVTFNRRQIAAAYEPYAARVLLIVFLLLGAIFVITADSVSDALRAFNFTMLLMFGPIALHLSRYAGSASVTRVGRLAFVGVLLGLLSILAYMMAFGVARPSGLLVGPIVLSNALLALGFIALGAALRDSSRWTAAYVLAPLIAIAAVAITGSRGPLIAVPLLVLVSLWFFWRYRFGASRRAAWLSLLAIGVAAILAFLLLHGRSATLFEIVKDLFEGDTVTDQTTRIRFVLYQAGWKAFLQSPWIGHGWGNMMDSVKPFLSAENRIDGALPHLHNDVLNFAVAGGVVGIGAYFAILSTPLVSAILSVEDSFKPFRLFAATVLVIVYFCGGLTDLTFGFEYHTYLFVMLSAIILAYCRDAPEGLARSCPPQISGAAAVN